MEQDTIVLLQCALCKRRNFTEEYEGGPLTCTSCGAVGALEDIQNLDQEIANLANTLKSTGIEYQPTQEEQLMIQMAEKIEKDRKQQMDIADLMNEQLHIKSQKRPRKRNRK